ncbi:MAG: PTS transporter subunit EIIC, partial [Metamycoplasmataceae bacterium]
ISTGGLEGSISAFADGTNPAFILFGGTGTTLGLVVSGLLLSKKAETREIIKFGGAPALFNINEPIIFGIPLILNFKYVIPFVIIQPLLFFITWLAIEILQWVPPVIVKIPWTSPIGIGAFLATSSWQGIVLALFNFSISIGIYTPFVLMANKSAKKKGEELVKIDYKGGWQKFTARIHNRKVVEKDAIN